MNSKKKGNRGENQLVYILCEAFGEGKFKRTPSSGAYTGGKNREGAENLPWEAKITLASDIICPANFNFIIEHKFYAEANFWNLLSENSKWLEWTSQAEGDASFVNKTPLIIVKYNRHKRIALIPTMYLEHYAYSIEATKPKNEMMLENARFARLLADKLRWRTYSVVMLEELLKLPKEGFWFTENKEDA
jgi:hypothetical protein